MTRFEDQLFAAERPEDHQKAQQMKALKDLLRRNPPRQFSPLNDYLQPDPPFVAQISSPIDTQFQHLRQNENIAFICCESQSADRQAMHQVLVACEKPVLIQTTNPDEIALAQMRLAGFAGIALEFSGQDLASIQMVIEVCQEYDLHVLLQCRTVASLSEVPRIDCPTIWVKGNFPRSELNKIPTTRRILLELDELSQVEAYRNLAHPLGFIITNHISNFTL